MSTTAKKTVNKKTVTNKKSEQAAANDTKVVCPVCGSEFAIGDHEHTVKNATVIGADSGMGTVYMPLKKRGDALAAAGIDISKYFAIQLPTGGEQIMKMGDDGKTAVPVDDPVILAIMRQGTVPNRNLFRRWVMSQVFHWLISGDQAYWLTRHGYIYTWEMLVEELRVQAKLFGRDMENFRARNRWFNKDLAVKMAEDYIDQMVADAKNRPVHKCKGVPYVKFSRQNIFVSDIYKKLEWPMRQLVTAIKHAKTPQALYEAVRNFHHAMYSGYNNYKQCAAWKDAYKGMGAYATMQNLLRFHGCTFPKDNEFYHRGKSDLQLLEDAASSYEDGEGWRLFGLMKQMIAENGIDIKAKMAQWSAVKDARNLRR